MGCRYTGVVVAFENLEAIVRLKYDEHGQATHKYDEEGQATHNPEGSEEVRILMRNILCKFDSAFL